MFVYVSGPYSAETAGERLRNVQVAAEAAVELMELGHVVFCPHLCHYLDAVARGMGRRFSYERWIRQDLELLSRFEGLVCVGDSPGARLELHRARELGLLIAEGVEGVRGNPDWRPTFDGGAPGF